jgi:4-oxalocrotonate tautomerase
MLARLALARSRAAGHLSMFVVPAIVRAQNTGQEIQMPEIYVHAVKGRTLEQKRALIKDITDAVVKNFTVPAEAVTVEIMESEPTAKAKGGVLFSEMRR